MKNVPSPSTGKPPVDARARRAAQPERVALLGEVLAEHMRESREYDEAMSAT